MDGASSRRAEARAATAVRGWGNAAWTIGRQLGEWFGPLLVLPLLPGAGVFLEISESWRGDSNPNLLFLCESNRRALARQYGSLTPSVRSHDQQGQLVARKPPNRQTKEL
jgi:hypothetical protein